MANPAAPAIRQQHPVLAFAQLDVTVEKILQVVAHSLQVVRVVLHEIAPLGARAQRHVRLDTHNAHCARRRIHTVVDDIPIDDAIVRSRDRQGESLLALTQRIFCALALGNVVGCTGHPHGFAAGVAKALPARMNPADRAVAQNEPILDLELRSDACDLVVNALLQRGNVVGMDVDQRAEFGAGGEVRIGLQLEDFTHHRRHEKLVACQIPNPVPLFRAGGRDHVAFFRLAQRIFCAAVGIDVADRSGESQRFTLRVTHAKPARAYPMPAAVLVLHAVLDRVRGRTTVQMRLH